MEEQVPPASFPPADQPAPQVPFQIPASVPGISLEALEQMKARAREEAIRITMEQRSKVPAFIPQPPQAPAANVVYIRRNLTIAELLLTLLLACGLVTGTQLIWKAASSFVPHIEVKVK